MWQLDILKYNNYDNCYDVYQHIGTFDTDHCVSISNQFIEKYYNIAGKPKNKWKIRNKSNDDIDVSEILTTDNIVDNIRYYLGSTDHYVLQITSHHINPTINVEWLVRELIHVMKQQNEF